jgi:hypothetical protein
VVRAADGANKRIAAELGVNLMTVLRWRRRFEGDRLAGLHEAPRPGRPPTYTRADRDRPTRRPTSGRGSRMTCSFLPGIDPVEVETWFSVLTSQAIRLGSFRSVKELIAMIDTFTANWNTGSSPFVWTTTADEILAKAVCKDRVISESRH